MKHQEFILAIHSEKTCKPGSFLAGLYDACSNQYANPLYLGSSMTLQTFDEEVMSELVIRRRAELEVDFTCRQLLPYILVRCAGKYLVYQRTKGVGEDRLLGNYSIGLGGHIDITDLEVNSDTATIDLAKTIAESTSRELGEELKYHEPISFCLKRFVPLISSDSPVDEVHIALVAICDLPAEAVTAEEALVFKGYMTKEELKAVPNLESWSQKIVDNIDYIEQELAGE